MRQRREGCGIRIIRLLTAVLIGALHEMLEHSRIHALHMVALVCHVVDRRWAETVLSTLGWAGAVTDSVWNDFAGYTELGRGYVCYSTPCPTSHHCLVFWG